MFKRKALTPLCTFAVTAAALGLVSGQVTYGPVSSTPHRTSPGAAGIVSAQDEFRLAHTAAGSGFRNGATPAPTPSATPAPATAAAAPAAPAPSATAASGAFQDGPVVVLQDGQVPTGVTVCGAQLCLNGAPWTIHGATAYGHYSDPSGEIALAKAENLNTLELVEFDSQYHQLSDVESAATWDRVDAFIAAAGQAGLHVILHLAEYGQSLDAAGQCATCTDWGPYLSFIANRVNTVSGVRYADDPTIAMVELWGEIPMPNGGVNGTAQDMLNFFQRTLAEWHQDAPNILVSTGGFSYLNLYQNGGIPWQQIMSDPNNAVCGAEVNSTGDLDTTVPMVRSYCAGIGKGYFLSAWSSCQGSSQFSGDLDHFATDADMAAHATAMEQVQSVGNDFWNLGQSAAQVG